MTVLIATVGTPAENAASVANVFAPYGYVIKNGEVMLAAPSGWGELLLLFYFFIQSFDSGCTQCGARIMWLLRNCSGVCYWYRS